MTAWDEMVTGRRGVRPHWRPVLGAISSLDRPGLAARTARLQRAAEEEGNSLAWRCDPIPLPVAAAEFRSLERGLCQRARLLEAILADLYAEQATLAQGALPPALVFANPGFLRACRGDWPGAAPFLQAYAADVVRTPDGEWRVIADRTEGAPGIGIAREARRLLARVIPELFRANPVRELRPFFDAWQEALVRSSSAGADRPAAIAVLTHGAADPHWPDHLALSRELGCALVETRDLSVRDGALWLKTLGGLKPIDVLLRRIPGDELDSLENDPREHQGAGPGGVMGLLGAARRGAVRLVNHPGAALVEAPGLAGFMPSLCRLLLGEPLRLATMPSLWLADGAAQRTVAAGFRRWAIRPAFDPDAAPVVLADLPPDRRIELQRRVEAEPWRFAGCAPAAPSLAPCQGRDGLDARPVVLRLFLIRDGVEWRMMPGGVARVIDSDLYAGERLPADGLFKDVWVMSEENSEIVGPDARAQPKLQPRRTGVDLPSRVADDFFWLGRYVERLEAIARVGRAGLLRRGRDALLPRELAELDLLGECLGGLGIPEATAAGALEAAIWAAVGLGGAGQSGLDNVARLVSSLRDRLTTEAHAAFGHAIRVARSEMNGAGASGVDGLVHAMTGLQRLAIIIAGVAADGMVRGGGRLFLDLGRRIERAVATARLLATVLDQPASHIDGALRLALELCDSVLTYRSRYMAELQPGPVLDLVLADDGNPRALAYQYLQMCELLESAGDSGLSWAAHDLHDRSCALATEVLGAPDAALAATGLPASLRDLATDTAALSNGITRRFFALLPPAHAIGLEVA